MEFLNDPHLKLRRELDRLMAKRSFPAAMKAAATFLDRAPDDVQALFVHSYCLTKTSDPHREAKIRAHCERIIIVAEPRFSSAHRPFEAGALQWAFNALAWYNMEKATTPAGLEAALRLAETGAGIAYNDQFNEIIDTEARILLRLGRDAEAFEIIRLKLQTTPAYPPFQSFKRNKAYRAWLRDLRAPTAPQALDRFDRYAKKSRFFAYTGVSYEPPLDQPFIARFAREDFALPPSLITLVSTRGLPKFLVRGDQGMGSVSCELLHPHEWESTTWDLSDTHDRPIPAHVRAFQFFATDSVSDYYAFNCKKRRKDGELEIGTVFHDERYTACRIRSFDEHMQLLVERLISASVARVGGRRTFIGR